MTNFEKWKKKLTLKKFIKDFLDSCPGKKCPAFKVCEKSESCRAALKKWASGENLNRNKHIILNDKGDTHND